MECSSKWKCEICGYVHEGSEPPENCPICGVGKEFFNTLACINDDASKEGISSWKCTVCGYIHEGSSPPDKCPVCAVDASLFEPHETVSREERPTGMGGIVIIGGGIAGLTAAENARSISDQCSIKVISQEESLPYYRMNLTRYMAGEITRDELLLHGQEWYDNKKIELVFGGVEWIDSVAKQLKLTDNSHLMYDHLIIANGSHPFIPPFPGVDTGGVFSFRTIEDADQIMEYSQEGMNCVCIGGGLLGIETAGALSRRGLNVTILEGHDHLLSRQLPKRGGDLLQEHLERVGINTLLNARTDAILGERKVDGIRLQTGEVIEADLVIVSTGVRPTSYLAIEAGLKVNHGVVVDDHMLSSKSDIWAAGDVAEFEGNVFGIWPVSYSQGAVAGINSAGGSATYRSIPPANMLKVMDVDLYSVGEITALDGSYHCYEDESDGVYRYILCRDNVIVGAALYGDLSLADTLKLAIENQSAMCEVPELNDLFKSY